MIYFLSVLFIFTVVHSVPVQKWHKSQDGNLYFIEQSAQFNWFGAWNECSRKNMSLLAIESSEKYNEINVLIEEKFKDSNHTFWLGGHDMAITDRYEWATSGQIFTFTNWASYDYDSDDNDDNHCVVLMGPSWQWDNDGCTNLRGFICEENPFLKEKTEEINRLISSCDEALKIQCSDQLVVFHNN